MPLEKIAGRRLWKFLVFVKTKIASFEDGAVKMINVARRFVHFPDQRRHFHARLGRQILVAPPRLIFHADL